MLGLPSIPAAISAALDFANSVPADLINMVPDPSRVTIIPVKEYAPVPVQAGKPYVTMFNPENWTYQDEVETAPMSPQGSTATEQRHVRTAGRKVGFDILIDGTGASGEKRDVPEDVEKFHKVTGYNSKTHSSNKLILFWGQFIFQCILKKTTIKYTLFRPTGVPLRAVITVEFEEDVPREQEVTEAARESADLTHRRIIKTGDRIDNLCQEIYDTNRHYLSVAQANNLTSFRNLLEGQEMYFPPLEK